MRLKNNWKDFKLSKIILLNKNFKKLKNLWWGVLNYDILMNSDLKYINFMNNNQRMLIFVNEILLNN